MPNGGLPVVMGQVGGVPEVMPDKMIKYAKPDAKDIIRALQVIRALF